MAMPAEPPTRLGFQRPKARAFIERPKDGNQSTIAFNYIYWIISQKYATDRYAIQQLINGLTPYDHRAPAQFRVYTVRQ